MYDPTMAAFVGAKGRGQSNQSSPYPETCRARKGRTLTSLLARGIGPREGKWKPEKFARYALYPAPLAMRSLPKTATVSVSSAAKRLRYPIALGAAMLMLGLAAGPLSAQEYWPPDEPSPGGQNAAVPQQYPPAQQFAYPQSQSPQSAYQQYPQPIYQGPAQPYSQQGYGQQLSEVQALNPDQLTQLVAPIALYPDALVAQILAASTYPAQVSEPTNG